MKKWTTNLRSSSATRVLSAANCTHLDILQNDDLLLIYIDLPEKIGFDTEENLPSKIEQNEMYRAARPLSYRAPAEPLATLSRFTPEASASDAHKERVMVERVPSSERNDPKSGVFFFATLRLTGSQGCSFLHYFV